MQVPQRGFQQSEFENRTVRAQSDFHILTVGNRVVVPAWLLDITLVTIPISVKPDATAGRECF